MKYFAGTEDIEVAPKTPKWFPKKQETISKWQEVYQVILDTEARYKQDYYEWDIDNPQPKLGDLADAIGNELGFKYSEKIIGRIRKAGRMGLLES